MRSGLVVYKVTSRKDFDYTEDEESGESEESEDDSVIK